MAFLAAQTNVGTRKRVNEDSCCIEVAQTSLGEVLMAIVCDGVGGLSRGDIASSTVVDRFVRWFERTLPSLMADDRSGCRFDLEAIRRDWDGLLRNLNTEIRAYGLREDARLGTTFTGIIACGGCYLIGHVGDCRAYRLRAGGFEQLTVDQTAVARRLAAGEISAEEARRLPRNVISQAVGAQQGLAPAYYQGDVDANDLFVLCCDGAYHRIGSERLARVFASCDFRDERALDAACREVIRYDLDQGERDNLTVLCFSGALDGTPTAAAKVHAGGAPTAASLTASYDDDDAPTMVEFGAASSDDDAPTTIDSVAVSLEDDVPTMVDAVEDDFKDGAPAMVESDEDDAPTMVDPCEDDDFPTMVDLDAVDLGDDVPTAVDFGGGDLKDGVPAMVDPDEDDAPTMVDPDEGDLPTAVEFALDPDDAPTMVEGGDV